MQPPAARSGSQTNNTEPEHQTAGGTQSGTQATTGEVEPGHQTTGGTQATTGEIEPEHQPAGTTSGTQTGETESAHQTSVTAPPMTMGSIAVPAPVACQLGDDCFYEHQPCRRQTSECALTVAGCLACL
jgi:hypothetical protein